MTWNPCRNRRCGHTFRDHDENGKCTAYHCRCRRWRPVTREEWERGDRR